MPLEVDYDEDNIEVYKVFNDYNDLILQTGDGYLAMVIAAAVKGQPRNVTMVIGGDPGTKRPNVKIFRKKR